MQALNNIRIVLVNTSHPGNIGAAARAMKNMGLASLYLVAPKDFPSGVARGRAASAVDVLENAVVTETLQEAISDCGLVIATSARSRHIPWPVFEPCECAERLINAAAANQVALVFGREDRGLTNEELQLAHFHVQIPASEDYSSLNLAAAVMVLAYEIRKSMLTQQRAGDGAKHLEQGWDQELATSAELEHFLGHLERVMTRLKFHDPANPRQLLPRLHRLYGRINLDKMEINMLRGILSATEQVMDKNEGREA
ncbi:MAG: RNA methyltransferase [Pseudohongiellaceae bacterium]